MKIVLDQKLENDLLAGNLTPHEWWNFEYLLHSMDCHEIFIELSRRLIDGLFENGLLQKLGYANRVFLQTYKAYYSTIVSGTAKISTLLCLRKEKGKEVRNEPPFDLILSDLPRDVRPYLLCEDISDCAYYLKVYQLAKGGNNIFLGKLHAGGCNESAFDNHFEDNKIIFAVIDSDKGFPSDDNKQTARTFLGCVEKNKPPFLGYHILETREKENTFPPGWLRGKNAAQKKFLSFLSSCQRDIKDFFDIKNGIDENGYETQRRRHENACIVEPVWKDATEKGYLISNDKGEKRVGGIGGKLVDETVAKSQQLTGFLDHLTTRQRKDWEDIFNKILLYGFRYYGFRQS